MAEALGVAPGTAMVVALRRLRLAGDEPLVVETSYLPARAVPGSRDGRLLGGPPVRHADDGTAAARPARARRSSPSSLTADEAALLDQRRGEPALRVERIAFDQDDLPIEFCRSTVRGDRYRYSVELRDR